MKPLTTAYKQHILTGALFAALAINATWRLATPQTVDFASTSAELEETVVTAQGAFKAKYWVIGNRTTVRLEAMDGGAQCDVCNTYDLDGVVLDKNNKKSITEVNIALMKQIEGRSKPAASEAKLTISADKKSDKKPTDLLTEKCADERKDEFTFCAIQVLTSLSAEMKEDRAAKAQLDTIYRKHIRKDLLKMMADIENEERSQEAYDSARQMIEDLYPTNAKAIQEDLTSLISKAMAARAVDISEKFVVSKSMERSNPQEAMTLFQEFLNERNYFNAQVRSVNNDILESFSSHVDDGLISSSALRMMMLKSYQDPMKKLIDQLYGSNPEKLASSFSDSDLGIHSQLSSGRSGLSSRTGRSLRNALGNTAITPSTAVGIQRGSTIQRDSTTTRTSGRGGRF